MNTVAVKPSFSTNLSHSMDSENNLNHLRVASFSAYLKTPEDNFMLKLAGTIQESGSSVISPDDTPRTISFGRKNIKEGEISVFGADKYFNTKADYGTPGLTDNDRKHENKREDQVDLQHQKPKFRTGTPSTTSQASWNSQTALLPGIIRSPSLMKQKKALGKRFFLGFGCNGACLDKKSVYVNGSTDQHGMLHGKEASKESIEIVNPVVYKGTKQSRAGLKRGEHFAFPVLNSGVENLALKRQLEEEARKSLEVFGSNLAKKSDIAANLERKLSMLSWDAIPKAQNPPTTLGSGTICDDIESDASSDLFEIENISGTGQYSLLTIQASDNMSSCMTPTTLYEPSEASIEWSVITASAADFSVASDYDEKSIINAGDMISRGTANKTARTKNMSGKAQNSHPGGLLGCRSNKAVGVDEIAYRANEKPKSMSLGKPQFSFASKPISP